MTVPTTPPPSSPAGSPDPRRAHFTAGLHDLAATAVRTAERLADDLGRAAALVEATVRSGRTLFFCGNGGSAADAQHVATEYVVRFMRTRRAYPAVALTTDTSCLTACGNDFGFETVFARQIEALGQPGDLLVIHSTSGTSPNVLRAADAARARGLRVLALTARDGGTLADRSDVVLVVPTDRTDRAQELHLAIEHLVCDWIERTVLDAPVPPAGPAGDPSAS